MGITLGEHGDWSVPRILGRSVLDGWDISRSLRPAWQALGGRESFGLPLTEAFTRPSDDRIVQYFEGAVLERDPDVDSEPGLSQEDQIKLWFKDVAHGFDIPTRGVVIGNSGAPK